MSREHRALHRYGSGWGDQRVNPLYAASITAWCSAVWGGAEPPPCQWGPCGAPARGSALSSPPTLLSAPLLLSHAVAVPWHPLSWHRDPPFSTTLLPALPPSCRQGAKLWCTGAVAEHWASPGEAPGVSPALGAAAGLCWPRLCPDPPHTHLALMLRDAEPSPLPPHPSGSLRSPIPPFPPLIHK